MKLWDSTTGDEGNAMKAGVKSSKNSKSHFGRPREIPSQNDRNYSTSHAYGTAVKLEQLLAPKLAGGAR